MIQKKIKRVQALLKKQDADFLFVGNFGHQVADDILYWLLLQKLEYGFMLIPKKGKPTLYAISFEVDQLAKEFSSLTVLPFDKKVHKILNEKPKAEILFNPSALPVSVHSSLMDKTSHSYSKFQNHHNITASKFSEEIIRMEKAAEITDQIFSGILENWDIFRKESDVAKYIKQQILERDLEPSFSPIVASGVHAADPHHQTADAELSNGFCVIDMGVKYKGYCSDMTRTLYIGKPSTDEIELYDIVLSAQEQTTAKVDVNISVKELDTYCRNILGAELTKEFVHGLGHGVGSQVHEWPSVSGKSDAVLPENCVITIEPGVYKKGSYGIRIEDDVVVTKKGPHVLNKSTKELIILPLPQ